MTEANFTSDDLKEVEVGLFSFPCNLDLLTLKRVDHADIMVAKQSKGLKVHLTLSDRALLRQEPFQAN